MATIKARIMTGIESVICFVRKTWRPVMLAGVATATWVNLVFIPILTRQVPNLAEAAAWVGACGLLQWVREWGKVKGVAE